ncbi:MAG TPA: tetratricopeptide repeat protein [Phycisphaerae bacterium]|nr:tetratricopeptide repeat protein [Phycisphaerae bacterium]
MAKKCRNAAPQQPTAKRGSEPNLRAYHWLAVFVIAAATSAAYYTSFHGAFLLDDYAHLADDRFADPWPPWPLLTGPRPVVDLSLAINYAIGGIEPWSFHAFNLAVHLAAALTLFGLVRRSLARTLREPAEPLATGAAACAAILWAVHPLNTQAVTYVIQRGESMMGLFYLLMLYGLVRGADSRRAIPWYVCAVASCALGMATKAVMVTAPVVALLYDRAVLSPSWRHVLLRRWPVHLALAATWSVLWWLGIFSGVLETSPDAGSTVGFGVGAVTPAQYALTQPGVILHYLRLTFWPHPLCLDYFDWPVVKSLAEAFPALMTVALLLIATMFLWVRRPGVGFLAAAFFIILAPTSSFVPVQDMAFEHRMYLPLAALISLIMVGLGTAASARPSWRKPAVAVVLVVAVALSAATWTRNKLYADPVEMWRGVVARRPNNARAHNNLAIALRDRADPAEALEHLSRALRISPNTAKIHVNVADQLAKKGQFEEVAAHYRRAVELQPGLVDAHYNLANCLKRLGRPAEAIAEYRETQKLNPSYLEAYIMLGNLFAEQDRQTEAIEEFQTAIAAAGPKSNPLTLAKAHYNLGNSLAKEGRNDLALIEYEQAVRLNPQHYEAQYGIGYAHTRMEHPIEAVAAYRAALAINPDYGPARVALEHYVGKEDAVQPASAPR